MKPSFKKLIFLLAVFVPFFILANKSNAQIMCPGSYDGHIQGIDVDEENNIYCSFTVSLIKMDDDGNLLKKIDVPSHHGDLCYLDGKIYVAVNLGKFNQEKGAADSWVYVYNASDLSFIKKYEIQQAIHGAGGIEYHNGHFFVIGGLPKGYDVNFVFEYDKNFKFIKKHIIKSGYTRLGIQTAAYADGRWFFGCYGKPQQLLITDDQFNMIGRYNFNAAVGIAPIGKDLFYVARRLKGEKERGKILVARYDEKYGLILEPDYTEFVNPLMGTDSEFALSAGNTYPAIARPWGMNFWTPQTGKMNDGWGYTYDAHKIVGFKQTHQPSPWINDYAAFSVMPITGKIVYNEKERASWFSHKAEIVKPYYYSVYFADYDVTTEFTPTERAVYFRFTFPKSDSSYILIDAFDKGSQIEIDPEKRKISGYCRNNHGGVPENFHNYFVIVFDKDFDVFYTWNKDKLNNNNKIETGEHVGAIIGFKTEKGEIIHAKIASSFISPEQAELNLHREIAEKDFETVKNEGKNVWNRELSRIRVQGGTPEQTKTFYSALYRTLLFPRKFYEINAENKIVHYSPYNGKVLEGYLFTDNGFWDTFRAVFPFFTMMYPELNSQIMQGLVNTYKENGWLPEWASPGHRDCMIGSNSASLIADSYLKGIRGYDIELLYEAIIKNTKGQNPKISSVGRKGAEYYNKLGYIPYDVKINENTARTLEYAYDDFCIWRLAEKLNRPQNEIDLFKKRAQNYRNVFDKESGWMRGRNKNGAFQSPFNPLKWGDAFTEGNSLHYTWSVFQDIDGLIGLMGGKEKFVAKLDTIFTMPPHYDCSYYGFPIHEIREMQVINMGNYAHGNQPIQHMIYLYNYAGAPWKTQKWVRTVMNKLYSPTPDGYCGDEDNGQTSAWYVFSAMGFYPVCPGSNQYVIGSPLFSKITLDLENGKTFKVIAENNSAENIYIRKAQLNGKLLDRNYIRHSEIMNGGKIQFWMSDKPNYNRGVKKEDAPYSMPQEEK